MEVHGYYHHTAPSTKDMLILGFTSAYTKQLSHHHLFLGLSDYNSCPSLIHPTFFGQALHETSFQSLLKILSYSEESQS